MNELRRLVRPRTGRMLAGVCKGLADYLGIDATVIRVVYALLTFFSVLVGGTVAYIIMMIIIPEGE